ncbi:TlpA family protein disulfide reductase [Sodalis sp. RH16]|uniref:TlpA family protein disulfide reductase n=1 Tax=Sodalis sp. RH16 TaxID=3394331 RepID=UPI0039B393C3
MNWRRAVSLFCLLALAAALGGCKDQQQVAIGAKAPSLAAFDLRGQPAALEKWHGKQVYLTFWAADCGGCAADLAALQKLTDSYGNGSGLVVVAVNTDPQQTDIAPFLGQLHLSYPVVRDQLGITKERYQVIGTPTSYLIDGQGQVVEVHQGMQGEPALAAMFRQAQQGKS